MKSKWLMFVGLIVRNASIHSRWASCKKLNNESFSNVYIVLQCVNFLYISIIWFGYDMCVMKYQSSCTKDPFLNNIKIEIILTWEFWMRNCNWYKYFSEVVSKESIDTKPKVAENEDGFHIFEKRNMSGKFNMVMTCDRCIVACRG